MPLLHSLVAPSLKDDADLLAKVRKGDERAYGELWRRHSKAGLRVAQSFRNSGDADDLVSESFVSIYSALRNGAGPAGAFRPYLYATIRNLAQHTAKDPELVNHEVDFDSLPAKDVADDLPEDAAFIFSAFRSLPARWQSVIWYVEVEQMRMAEVGNLLGIKANAVSALVFRAKSALRVAWLQSQIESANLEGEHRDVVVLLGGYAQKSLRSREQTRVSSHLSTCLECSQIADEVDGLARRIAVIVLPLVLGGAAAAAFSPAIAGAATTTAAAAGTAATSTAVTSTAVTSTAVTGTAVTGTAVTGTAVTGTAAAATSAGLAGASAIAGSISGLMVVALVAGGAVLAIGTVLALTVFAPSSGAPHVATPLPASSPSFSEAPPESSAPSPSGASPSPIDPSASPVVPAPVPSGSATPSPSDPRAVGPVSPPASTWLPDPLPLVRPAGSKPTIDGGGAPRVTNSSVVLVTGRGSGGAVIVISEGSIALSTAPVSDSGTWQFSSRPLSEGPHALSFVERRSGFTESAAVFLTITVDSVAPASPSFHTTALAADFVAPTFYGRADPDAVVTLRDGSGVELASVTAGPDGEWMSGAVPGLAPDSLSFSATQTDEAGNQSAETPLVLAPFVPTFDAPTDGAIFAPSRVAIHLLGWPGVQVRVAIVNGGSGTFTFDSSGSLSLTMTQGGGNLSAGSYTVSASYLDVTANAAVTFRIS